MNKTYYSIILFLIFIIPLANVSAFLSEPKRFTIPKKIEAFNLLQNKVFKWDLKKSVSQKGLEGTVISFLSSKCPCSNSHLTHLMDLQKKFPEYLFIGINSNKKGIKKEVRSFFKQKRLSFPILLDTNLKLANSFRALKTPHTFVINEEGRLLFHGGITNSINFKFATKFYLKESLSRLNNKEPLEQIYARTIGCSIAR